MPKKKEYSGFALRLREIREAKGVTQQQLADAVKMTVMGISRLENGRTEPFWATVVKLAKALGSTTDAFIYDDPPPVETHAGRPPTLPKVSRRASRAKTKKQ